MGESNLAPEAIAIAAKQSGLRIDEIEAAVLAYRAALQNLHEEPEWSAYMHTGGSKSAYALYRAEGTKVFLQIESHKKRDEWQEERFYVLGEDVYESFSEARAIELLAETRPTPREVRP